MTQLPEKNVLSMPQLQPAVAPVTPRLATAGQFIAVVLIWSLTPLAAVWTVHEIHWAWGFFSGLVWLFPWPCSVCFIFA